jgi:hypothetical protein
MKSRFVHIDRTADPVLGVGRLYVHQPTGYVIAMLSPAEGSTPAKGVCLYCGTDDIGMKPFAWSFTQPKNYEEFTGELVLSN